MYWTSGLGLIWTAFQWATSGPHLLWLTFGVFWLGILVVTVRQGVGVSSLGLVTSNAGLRRTFIPWETVDAFDHEESRVGGSSERGPAALRLSDGTVVRLPEVRRTGALVAILRERLGAPQRL